MLDFWVDFYASLWNFLIRTGISQSEESSTVIILSMLYNRMSFKKVNKQKKLGNVAATKTLQTHKTLTKTYSFTEWSCKTKHRDTQTLVWLIIRGTWLKESVKRYHKPNVNDCYSTEIKTLHVYIFIYTVYQYRTKGFSRLHVMWVSKNYSVGY